MLTYATILIASLILAVVVLFLYNVISDSSRSVYSSKDRIAVIDRHPEEKKGKTRHSAVTNAMNSVNRRDGAKQWSMAKSTPAVPAGNSGRGNQVPGQLAHHAAGVANVSHCSLYNVNAAEPESKHTRNAGRLSREGKRGPSGNIYKVKRNSAPSSTNSQGINDALRLVVGSDQ